MLMLEVIQEHALGEQSLQQLGQPPQQPQQQEGVFQQLQQGEQRQQELLWPGLQLPPASALSGIAAAGLPAYPPADLSASIASFRSASSTPDLQLIPSETERQVDAALARLRAGQPLVLLHLNVRGGGGGGAGDGDADGVLTAARPLEVRFEVTGGELDLRTRRARCERARRFVEKRAVLFVGAIEYDMFKCAPLKACRPLPPLLPAPAAAAPPPTPPLCPLPPRRPHKQPQERQARALQ